MALEVAFKGLHVNLLALQEAFGSLRLTVVEDLPETRATHAVADVKHLTDTPAASLDQPLLAHLLGDTVDEICGLVAEAHAAAVDGQRAVRRHADLGRAARALVICQQGHDRVASRFYLDLVRYEQIAQLNRLGRERGRDWRAWASCVNVALEACRQPLTDVNEALVQCWQEIAEWVGISAISPRATGIRKQVIVPATQGAVPTLTESSA